MDKKIVFSGIQPTNSLHLGNYLCAINQWKALEKEHECYFSIVDLHALTANMSATLDLKETTISTLALYIACGLNYQSSTIFAQSNVLFHTNLAWILSCHTNLGLLNKSTQFKDKKGQIRENLGLYSYPVLMAADILLYDTDYVPVGDDQKQHIEITRDIAINFNKTNKADHFKLPQGIYKEVGRIMSLKNPQNKMSKSDSIDANRINLIDTNDIISKKIKKALTDNDLFPDTLYKLEEREGVNNLINIYSLLSQTSNTEIINRFAKSNISNFKSDLIDLCISVIAPIRDKYHDMMSNKNEMDKILTDGAIKANQKAEKIYRQTCKILNI